MLIEVGHSLAEPPDEALLHADGDQEPTDSDPPTPHYDGTDAMACLDEPSSPSQADGGASSGAQWKLLACTL